MEAVSILPPPALGLHVAGLSLLGWTLSFTNAGLQPWLVRLSG